MSTGSEHTQAAQELTEGAKRIIEMVRCAFSTASDQVLFEALTVAAGICFANSAFPAVPSDVGGRAGCLFAGGIQIGCAERMQLEKESCQGAA